MYDVQVCFSISVEEPGGDEWITLGGAVDALFAFRVGGIQKEVLLSQHCQYGSLWTLRHLYAWTFGPQNTLILLHCLVYKNQFNL